MGVYVEEEVDESPMLQKMVNSKNGAAISAEQLEAVSCGQISVRMFVEEHYYFVPQVFVGEGSLGVGHLEKFWKRVALYFVDRIDIEPN